MYQPRPFDVPGPKRVVNVASVPQRSPFRYPGGKTWLVPYIRQWLSGLPTKPHLLVEPFAGGGIIGLTAAFENLADQVLLVELDENVASVWQVLLGHDADWLADRILNFDLTRESVAEELSKTTNSLRDTAFRALLRNRTYHGGIMAPGSAPIRNGESGKGIRSRWYPETLSKRIRNLARLNDRIRFVHGDGLTVMRQHAHDADTVFFIDPPYTAAGKKAGRRLYTHNELDHEALFALTRSVLGQFLMTYDNAEDVQAMAIRHGFDFEPIPMKNTHHAEMAELLIGRDLRWARTWHRPSQPP
ncbi:MAG: DNA adenine methylase [Dehalococcoidia bacterium]|nr:DNA adenine methylase [Dehalococcoidia bacterium]